MPTRLLNEITRPHVLRAIQQVDSEGVPPRRGSRGFCLDFKGRHYPPKLIISYAFELSSGEVLASEDHSGGAQANNALASLGFSIQTCACRGGAPDVTRQLTDNTLLAEDRSYPKIAFISFSGATHYQRVKSIVVHLRRASHDGAQLLIAPEDSLTADGPFGATENVDSALCDATKESRVGLVVGRREQALRGSYRLRADVLDENGQLALSYYKHADPSYSKASRFQSAFDLHTDILRGFPIGTVNGLRVGVLICHDIIYPALAAQYAGRIDLLVTISGASVDARKWMTFVAARARELQVPATHVCAHGPDRTVPGSLALVSPCLTILAETSDLNDYNAPRTFRDKTTYVLADYAGAHRSLEPFLSVNDRGIRPNAGQVIRFQGSRRIIPVDSAILESGLSFQQIVSCHLGKPFLYLYSSHSPIAMPTIRARAIENVVPIAIARDGQYLVLNPTLYRQCSSYTVRDFARVDEMRQSATSLFKRIPAEPYKRLLSMGQRNLASYTSAP